LGALVFDAASRAFIDGLHVVAAVAAVIAAVVAVAAARLLRAVPARSVASE